MQLSFVLLVALATTACGYSYSPGLLKKPFYNLPYKGGYHGSLPSWGFGGGASLGLGGQGYSSYAFGGLGGGVLGGSARIQGEAGALGVGNLGGRGFRGSFAGGLGSWTNLGFYGSYGYPFWGYRYRFGDDKDFDFDFDFD